MLDELQEAASTIFLSILRSSATQNGQFRLVMNSKIVDAEKPLLIVGHAHSHIEDGHVIAVLNPDKSLTSSNHPIIGASTELLKEIVSGKCDAMIELWIDAYKEDGITRMSSYKSRTPMDARYEVR